MYVSIKHQNNKILFIYNSELILPSYVFFVKLMSLTSHKYFCINSPMKT